MKEFKYKTVFYCFSQYRAIQKGNHGAGQNRLRIGAYRVVHTLYWVIQVVLSWAKSKLAIIATKGIIFSIVISFLSEA